MTTDPISAARAYAEAQVAEQDGVIAAINAELGKNREAAKELAREGRELDEGRDDLLRSLDKHAALRDQAKTFLELSSGPAQPAEPKTPSKPRAKPGEVEAAVVGVLGRDGVGLDVGLVSMAAGYPPDSVRAVLRRLVKSGLVIERDGLYSLAPAQDEAREAAE